MEEQVMETKKQRPIFLTVLGILSFIGIGIQIISALFSILSGSVVSGVAGGGKSFSEDLNSFEGMDSATLKVNEAFDYVIKMAENATVLGIISIISALVCLLGVIWMWNLKKKGFLVYVIGELAPPIASIILVGFYFSGFLAAMSFVGPIIMIILYAINLKHMS